MSDLPRSLAAPQFPDDDGEPDPRLVDAFGCDESVLAVLAQLRVFVPIVPVLGERATDGSDKNADMAALLLRGADGRQALLAFSSVARLEAFNPSARPVPIIGADAARAAQAEGAAALLLDIGTDDFVTVETDDLAHLAQGHRLLGTPAGFAWVSG